MMHYQNKRNKTKKRIDDAFIEMYREKDISRITVREICEKSQINRSTFYTFYADVYALLESIEEECVSNVWNLFTQKLAESDDLPDIRAMVGELIRYCAQQNNLPVLLLRRGSTGLTNRITELAKNVLVSRLGELSEEDQKIIEFCMQYHISGMAAMFTAWENSEPERPVSGAVELLGDIANEGVATIFWEKIGQNAQMTAAQTKHN